MRSEGSTGARQRDITAATMQALAVVAGLLLLLLGTSHSFAQKEDATTCGDVMTTDSRICNELFQVFQASIVTNTANLYNLRKIFFPSKRLPPTLLNVSYELNFETEVQIPCDFDSNDTVNSSDTLYKNLGWTSQSIYTVFHPATLNRFQPQFFYEMMIQLESSNSEAALPWQGTDQLLTLHLFLHLKKLSCLPSHTQIYETLQDMTSVLKVYARDQKNLTEWQNKNSYVLDGRVFNEKWWKYECDIYNVISCNIRAINLFFSLFLSVAGGFAIVVVMHLIKGPKRKRDKNKLRDRCLACCKCCITKTHREAGDSETPDQGLDQVQQAQSSAPAEIATKEEKENVAYPFYHSLLWSATGVLFWGWLAAYVTEIIKIDEWRQHTPDTREVHITIIWLVIMLIATTSASFFISFRILITIDLLHPSNAIWGGIGGCRWDILICGFYAWLYEYFSCKGGLFKCIRWIYIKLHNSPTAKHVVGAIPLLVIFLWIGYIALNAVPIILYFLLYPTRVICLYTYVLAALAFLIFVITEGDYERRITKKSLKEQNQNVDTITWIKHHYLLYTSIFGLFFLGIATVVFIVTYRTIVAGGMTGNALYGIFRALIPALLLGAPSGWIGKRLKRHYRLEKEKAKETEPTQIHCTCTCRCSCNKEGAAEEANAGNTAITQC